ncbi:MAG: crossover junction endodeoxyribonuclease RuvC [Candidatus Saccharimonadales bacterium]
MSKIFGIDPGTAITGFGVIGVDAGKFSFIDAGVIRTPAKQALELRLETIYADLSQLIKEHNPDFIAIEQIYFANNVKTAISVAQARGVAMLAAVHGGGEVVEYTPLQIKQAITGYGRAEKKQMQDMVKILLGMNEISKPDDAADALAIAICHGQTLATS